MKKFVSIFLAIILALGLTATAFADGNNNNVNSRNLYDYDANWWYDWGGNGDTYLFDDDELKELVYAYAEAQSRAEGLAALYTLTTELQKNGMRLMRYDVVAEMTANHVYYIEAINREGLIWSSYFCSYTHSSAQAVMDAMLNGKKLPYHYIFLTTYVPGQRIKNYGEREMITSFDASLSKAISEFINVLNNYDYYWTYFYYWDYDYNYDPENG